MKRIIIFCTLILITQSVFSQNVDDLIIEKLIQTSGIKNQYHSNACWSFSTTSFLEAELKRIYNIYIELSPMYFVYYNYIFQAENYLKNDGNARFSPGGLAFHALDVYDKYGFLPTKIYEDNLKIKNYDCQEVYDPIKETLDNTLNNNLNKDEAIIKIKKILDKKLASVPDSFEFNHQYYTPLEFVEKIGKVNTKDYYRFTSYKDFGFYNYCNLPVDANWKNETYYNIPLNEFMELIESSIKNGFTLVWDGDVTEFITNSAVNYKIEKVNLYQYPDDTIITNELRQLTFNDGSTTEDHLSHIVGFARDKNGVKYFILKDSQGTENFSKGFIYLSENYIALKTISIVVHKDGIPRNIKEKMIMNE